MNKYKDIPRSINDNFKKNTMFSSENVIGQIGIMVQRDSGECRSGGGRDELDVHQE